MRNLLFILIVFALTGCAKRYYEISPSSFNYENRISATGPIRVTYVYDAQYEEHNKVYSKFERNTNLKLIGLKIENTSDEPVQIRQDNFFVLSASGRMITVVDASFYASKVRQKPEFYVLYYGLAGIGVYGQQDSNGKTDVQVTYNPIPLAIGIGNAVYAGIANNKMKRNLKRDYVLGRTIAPRGQLNGLLAISERGFPELIFEFSE